ncbi:MAG: hypothetical protein ACOX62_05255 [Christensenellales bacterium]
MKVLDIVGKNYFGKWDETRTSCRGIVMDGERILLSYETKKDIFSKHNSYEGIDEMRRGMYLREYTALMELI